MNGVTYRPIRRGDYPALKEMINQSFGLYRYISDPVVLNTLLNSYLQSCLAEQTFGRIAEKNGQVIGVIMGQAQGQYNPLRHGPYLAAFAYYSAKLHLQGALRRCDLSSYTTMHQIYKQLLAPHQKEFNGVLTLFAVTAQSRGLGVGKALLGELLTHLAEGGTRRFYLYTDSTCNVGFYNHQGFKRIETQPFTPPSPQKPMEVYLYGYNIE